LNAFLRGSLRTLRDIGWFALGWCSRVSPSGKLWQFKNIRGFGRLFAPVCAYLRLKLTAVRVSRMGRSSLVMEITVNYAYLRQITVVLLRRKQACEVDIVDVMDIVDAGAA
jgi:hypothetical protein